MIHDEWNAQRQEKSYMIMKKSAESMPRKRLVLRGQMER